MRDPVPNQLANSATPNATTDGGGSAPPQGAPTARRRLGFIAHPLVARLALVGVIAVGGILARDFISGSPDALRPGDCIDAPVVEQEIEQVQHHPCDQAHTAEVFAAFEYAASREAPYPNEATMDDVVMPRCYSEFGTYTGTSFEVREELDMTYLFPTQDGWTQGDRSIICVLLRVDGAAMTSSMRGSSR
jgi:hypothetical protein